MVVKIRLARFGKRHAPFYNIVVAHARTARNSRPLEVLGTYDPIPRVPIGGEGRKYKDLRLDTSRAKYWLGVGAQPSDPAWRLLSMVGLLEPKFGIAKKMERREREMTGDAGSASASGSVVAEPVGQQGMVGVEGEVEGMIRVSEQVGRVAEVVGEDVQEEAVKGTA